jgi:hypothetical protein
MEDSDREAKEDAEMETEKEGLYSTQESLSVGQQETLVLHKNDKDWPYGAPPHVMPP